MRLFQIVFISIIFIFNYSCKKNKSELNQVTDHDKEWTCDKNMDRANYYYNTYGKNNNSKIEVPSEDTFEDKDKIILDAFTALSNVPEEFLKHVFTEINPPMTFFKQEDRDGYVFISYDKDNKPIITFLASDPRKFPHEFGHTFEGYLWDKYPSKFEKELKDTSAILATTYKKRLGWYLKSYAEKTADKTIDGKALASTIQTRDRETFAEIFDTWYCSQEARISLKYCIPPAFDFAKKYLPLPDNTSNNIEQDIKPLKQMDSIVQASITTQSSSVCTLDKNSNELLSIQDTLTGNIWSNYKVESMTWDKAKAYCEKLNIKNRSFRLPTFKELQQFYYHGCFEFKVSEPLWSSSSPNINSSSAYTFIVDSNDSISYKNESKGEKHSFICVADACDYINPETHKKKGLSL